MATFVCLLNELKAHITCQVSGVPTEAHRARVGFGRPRNAMSNWSGYGLAGSGFTGVAGTFNVPAPLQSASCLEDTADKRVIAL